MINPVNLRAIGTIHSEHKDPGKIPIQSVYAGGCRGTVHVLPEFEEGLKDIEGFSHLFLIYHFHCSGPADMLVRPFLQDVKRGVFATRTPRRPNPVGLSIVELIRREANVLYIDNTDILDGTPVLDIKPYISRFDCIETTTCGWQDEVDDETAKRLGRRL